MELSPSFWAGRRVLLTGHTGFKGGWLALWLRMLGAEVQGYALPAATTPSLWEAARLAELAPGTLADIRDGARVAAAVMAFQPDIVLHLAAQPLVRASYETPTETYATNVMGTVHLLEGVRRCTAVRAVIVVTSDKCYDNREWPWPYREQDPLGGHDPYSSSKACTELVSHAYRQSFLNPRGIRLATARAGNVIGGGDWADNRLLPDLLRAFAQGETARLRQPQAIRPWQHVLDSLSGYLMVAEQLCAGSAAERAWNFGPESVDCVTTGELATLLATAWGPQASWSTDAAADFPHEAILLSLDAGDAKNILKWHPKWPLTVAIEQTATWHQAWLAGHDMQAICRRQIAEYANLTP